MLSRGSADLLEALVENGTAIAFSKTNGLRIDIYVLSVFFPMSTTAYVLMHTPTWPTAN